MIRVLIWNEFYHETNKEDITKSFKENKTKGIVGESYSINTPSLDFMKPDYEKVDFTLTEEGFYKKVVYDYSLEPVEKVNANDDFSYFMVDEEKGLVTIKTVIFGREQEISVSVNDIERY